MRMSTNSQTAGIASQTFAARPPSRATSSADRPGAGPLATSPSSFVWSAVAGADHYYLYIVDDTANTLVMYKNGISTTSYSPRVQFTHGHKY